MQGPAYLSAVDIRKAYGPVQALGGVSFEARGGEVLGILGPNGAGKSTLIRILAGVRLPDSGTLRIDGSTPGETMAGLRSRVGYLTENAPLWPELDVLETLGYGAGMRFRARGERRDAIAEAVDSCGLAEVARTRVSRLSRGFRQRLALALALLHRPELLVLDEPSTGLDPNQAESMRALVRSLAGGKTVILSTHNLEEAAGTCDRALLVAGGRIAFRVDLAGGAESGRAELASCFAALAGGGNQAGGGIPDGGTTSDGASRAGEPRDGGAR